MNNLASSSLGSVKPTCPTGVRLTNLRSLLPAKVTETILEALPKMDKMLPGFASNDALFTAPETRSSSPVRIIRDELFQGAGYAGGIVSAGVDGIRCAEAVLLDEGEGW